LIAQSRVVGKGKLVHQQRHGESDAGDGRHGYEIRPSHASRGAGVVSRAPTTGAGYASNDPSAHCDSHDFSHRQGNRDREEDRPERIQPAARENHERRHECEKREDRGIHERLQGVGGFLGEPWPQHEPESNARDGGVDARRIRRRPRGYRQHDEGHTAQRSRPPRRQAKTSHSKEERDGSNRGHERREIESVRKKCGDQHNRDEVIDHREGEQKDADARRQATPDEGNQAERERNVGRDGNRPSAREVGTRDEQVNEGGQGHSRGSSHRRCECPSRRIQFASGELVAKLHGDNEKEQGE